MDFYAYTTRNQAARNQAELKPRAFPSISDLLRNSTMTHLRSQNSLVQASSSPQLARIHRATTTTTATVPGIAPGLEHRSNKQHLNQNHAPLVYRQFELQAAQQPQKTAVCFEGQQISYAALNQRANQLARHLLSLGAGPDVLIGVCVERSLELMVTLLAIHKAGSAYLPLDLGYPSDRIQYILNNAQAHLLICNGDRNFPASQAQIIKLQDLAQQLNQYDHSNLHNSPHNDDLAYVIYTSGSTGNPKGVQIEHRSLSNLIQSMAHEPGLTAEDLTLAITTICFDISILELFMPLATGATMVLVSREVAIDGFRLRQVLEQQPITWAQATPSTWRMLLASGWQGNSRIRLFSGGEATTQDLAAQLLERCAELWNVYGPTETTIWSMVHRIMPGDAPIPLGKAIQRTQIYLMEELPNGELYPCLPNQPGEICIGGWGVARGYLNRPRLNRKKFVTDFNSREIGAKLYRTGDLGQELPDGRIQFLGRMDHQVKIRGHRVELGEVEAALLQHDQIHNAAVIATPDPSGSQQLVGYLVAQSKPSSNSVLSSDSASAPKQLDATTTNEKEIVDQWKTLWDDAYSNSPQTDPTFDFSGYGNSYTGELLSPAVVEEWTERTVERILALKPQRVLEVGCGKGLLLFRVAPHCDRYIGVDVTPAAITHLEQHLSQAPDNWSQVSLAQAAAHELKQLALLEDEQFDTIVINSVIQYFPDADYLIQVLADLTQLLQPGGRIFIGDIRNADLLQTFHTSLVIHQQNHRPAQSNQPTVQYIHQQVQQKSQQDVELLLAPPFFSQLQQHCPRITQVITQLKRGQHRSELTDFRYDAVLHLDQDQVSPVQIHWTAWQSNRFSLRQLQKQLAAQPAGTDFWGIYNIPNSRISASQHQWQQLQVVNRQLSLEAISTTPSPELGLDPEDLWQVAEDSGYRVHLRWSESREGATYDAIFRPLNSSEAEPGWASPHLAEPWDMNGTYEAVMHQPSLSCSNNPIQPEATHLAISELKQFLRQSLPAYMLPSQFVFLEQLPLTPNGKVDRKALPPVSASPILASGTESQPPVTATEIQLASIWEKLLNLTSIGREANFFESGGHSLLAAQLINCIQAQFSISMGLSSLFQNSTLAQLAQAIDEQHLSQESETAPPHDAAPSALAQQISADLALAKEIHLPRNLAPISSELNHIFLTGATGFVGGFLLQELLQQTQATLHCLVRSPNRAEAQRKLENHLEQCGVLWEQYRDRIITIPGDLAQPQLGLSAQQFESFQNQIDAIYHNGAYVNLIYPYSELRGSNVASTVELLKLASRGKLKPVHYISTLDVLNPEQQIPNQQLTEEQPLPHWSQLTSNYARTKWVSEQLILTARGKGIPCNIYRLGMTTGHSQNGFSNPTDMIGHLLQGLVDLQAAPDDNFSIHLAPVDIVCQAIATIGQPGEASHAPQGQTFHLCNPNPMSFQILVQNLRAKGYPLASKSYLDWFNQLMDCPADHALRSLLAGNFENSANPGKDFFNVLDLQNVSSANVENAMPRLSWPDNPSSLLNKYINALIHGGALAKPHPRNLAEMT